MFTPFHMTPTVRLTFFCIHEAGLSYPRHLRKRVDHRTLTILYEIDTVERFATPEDFSSYSRLVKGSVASAGQIMGSKGGKLGNPYLKWALMEAVVIMKRNAKVKKMGDRLEAKYGKQVGNAILANRLARAIYSMLSRNHPFDLDRFVTRRSK